MIAHEEVEALLGRQVEDIDGRFPTLTKHSISIISNDIKTSTATHLTQWLHLK